MTKKYYTSFSKESLINKEGAFYEKNQESIINQWKVYIEEQIEKVND